MLNQHRLRYWIKVQAIDAVRGPHHVESAQVAEHRGHAEPVLDPQRPLDAVRDAGEGREHHQPHAREQGPVAHHASRDVRPHARTAGGKPAA